MSILTLTVSKILFIEEKSFPESIYAIQIINMQLLDIIVWPFFDTYHVMVINMKINRYVAD